MSAAPSLIPELEDIVQHGSPRRRAQALRRITALFLERASVFNEDHVRLFDDVFNRLIDETKSQAHLLAISSRPGIAEPVTNVLVRRGDQTVARRVAENRGARLSDASF